MQVPEGRVRAAVRGRPSTLYYGWVLVAALGFTETVSYGILSYAFPVFLAPMEAELGWSKMALTGAFSLSSLVAGVAAIPVGRRVDLYGARGVMTAGSVLAVLLLLAWARVDRLAVFYAIWIGLGVASAAVHYEPAFAVVATWFDRHRSRALTLLTFVGGFASVIFVPLAAWLVAVYGWRAALVVLAGILAVLTVAPHALLLRHRPADLGLLPDGAGERRAPAGDHSVPGEAAAGTTGVSADAAVRSRSFRLLTAAFSLATLVTAGLAVHLIPLLLERGFDGAFAGAAMGAIGLVALPGRLIFTPLGGRWSRPAVTASIFGLQAVGAGTLMLVDAMWGVWAFVVLFGVGFGAITPARAALVAEFYGPAHYGRINGVMSMFLAVSRAVAPVGLSVLYAVTGGYGGVLMLLLSASLLAGTALLLADDPAASTRHA